MLPLSGLPRGDTSLLLAVTNVVELAKLAVVGYWLWRWKRDTDLASNVTTSDDATFWPNGQARANDGMPRAHDTASCPHRTHEQQPLTRPGPRVATCSRRPLIIHTTPA